MTDSTEAQLQDTRPRQRLVAAVFTVGAAVLAVLLAAGEIGVLAAFVTLVVVSDTVYTQDPVAWLRSTQ
jgi:hypothetical protein